MKKLTHNKIICLVSIVPFILTGCATFKYWSITNVPQEGGIKLVKITDKEDLVDTTEPFAISKDGQKIAFTSWKTGNGDIYIKNLAGGKGMTQRTFRNETEISPAFSPDGTQLVFTAYRDGHYHIYLIGAESGASIRQITTSSPADAINPTFSPDGQLIAFNSIDLQWDPTNNKWIYVDGGEFIWTFDVKTGALTQYVQGLMPKFTPDGKKIIFKRASKIGKQYYGIWMLDLISGAETNIISAEDFGIGRFDISPDGKKIVFTTDKGTISSKNERKNQNIWMIDIDGTNLTQLTFHPSDDLCPIWTPDMKNILFLSSRGEETKGVMNIWKMSFEK